MRVYDFEKEKWIDIPLKSMREKLSEMYEKHRKLDEPIKEPSRKIQGYVVKFQLELPEVIKPEYIFPEGKYVLDHISNFDGEVFIAWHYERN